MLLIPPTYSILYDNKNITKDVSPHLVSLTYTDKVEGESDEIEMVLEDTELLWQNEWYPKKGAKLTAKIIQDGLELSCGTFTIDEISLSSDRQTGDTVAIKGLAASITKKMRTRRSSAHEGKTLREIANTIADIHGLTVEGNIADIRLQRVTQFNETDLGFLHRLATDFGYTFSVRENRLTFTSIYDLEKSNHILTFDKTELLSWKLTDKTIGVYKKAKVKHHSRKKKEVIEAEDNFADASGEDYLEVKTRAENKQQAEAKSKAALHKHNSKEKTGSVTMPGNVLMVAGINWELTGMGTLSGIQHNIATTHTLDRSGGYVVSAEVKAVAKIAAAKWKPKKPKRSRAAAQATGTERSFFRDMENNLRRGAAATNNNNQP